MKRTLSLLVVLVMLVSMFSFMTTGVSANVLKSTYEDAKDGDLLYELKFGQTTGAYTPTIFKASIAEDAVPETAVKIYDDGRSLDFYKPSLTSGTFWYGGKIEGLTMGPDKVYSISFKLALPANRGGVHFNFPTDAKAAELADDTGGLNNNYASVMYGIYGRFTAEGDLGAMKSGSRINGRFRFDTTGYKEFNSLFVEEGTLLDVTYLIEGYSYSIFIGGLFIDVVDIPEADIKDVSDNLGFSVYLYHIKENVPMTVKDVNIYKGDIISDKVTYPSYAKTHSHYIEPVTTTEEPTTAPTTTEAPKTTTPSETTAATPATTTKAPTATTTAAPKAEGGCGSAVASGLALIALVSLAGVTVAKKQK